MIKFLLVLFLCLNVFAIDTLNVNRVTSSGETKYQLWSDTLTWERGANDSLLILDGDGNSFGLIGWSKYGIYGVYGWESMILYYQLGNTEADFDSMTTWSLIDTVASTSANPDVLQSLTLVPAKLVRFLAIATDSADALTKLQFLFLK